MKMGKNAFSYVSDDNEFATKNEEIYPRLRNVDLSISHRTEWQKLKKIAQILVISRFLVKFAIS